MDTISKIDLSGGAGPKYRVLAGSIERAIHEGNLAPGDKMPTVRDLAFSLNITPGTVARAYQRLTEAGKLIAHVGRGTFVAGREAPAAPAEPPVIRPLPALSDPGLLDLRSPVLPDVGQVALIRAALHRVADQPEERFLDYPTRVTDAAARAAVCRKLADFEIGPFDADDIVLSHGGQHAITLIFQAALKGPRPVILTEELSYAGFRHAARLMRAEVAAVEFDAEGPLPASIDAACRRHDVQLLATSAEAQNPTTIRTSARRRDEIVALARRHDFGIVEDECYTLAPSDLPAYRALAPERVWYVSSISKSLSPALRMGFFVTPEGKAGVGQLAARHGFFGLSGPITEVVAQVLGTDASRACRRAVEEEVTWRGQELARALDGFDLRWRAGVSFAFLHLPAGWRASSFLRAAEAAGVLLRPADEYVLLGGRAPNAVRIAINCRASRTAFSEACATLRRLLAAPPHEIDV